MFLVERILVMTLCYVGVCSNHDRDKEPSGFPPNNAKTYNGLAIAYFTSAKTNNPIEVSIVLTCTQLIIIKFYIFSLIDY